MNSQPTTISVVGAGLAGSECAFQLASMGYLVNLYEMRPLHLTPAHKTQHCAELVCSNSFGSKTDYSAPGQLKWEAEQMGSLILKLAEQNAVPAGMALSVDRDKFAANVSHVLRSHPRIRFCDERVDSLEQIPRPAVIATGPLTSDSLARSIQAHLDDEFLYFFDAIAPIVDADTINQFVAFKADRFNKGTRDYLNCPLNKEQYFRLVDEILAARKIEPKEFEKTPYFEGCMPIEVMAARGRETLRFGPLSPKGIKHPWTNQGSYAVVQLRQDNREGTAYNMVGFQTKMAYGEQVRVFRLIPGLENAEFLKLGSIHRNMYIQSPKKLTPWLASRKDPQLFFAGQITGVEGYFESTCIGLLVAHFVDQHCRGNEYRLPPRESALGSLLNAITEDNEYFQPTNINFGLMPKVDAISNMPRREQREKKRELQLERAKSALALWLSTATVGGRTWPVGSELN